MSIVALLDYHDIELVTVATGGAALAAMLDRSFDCVVLDLRLPDMTGFQLLEKMHAEPTLADVPVVVFTGKDLNSLEHTQLKMLAKSIVLKDVQSPERLLDETSLFLHRVVTDLPAEMQNMLGRLHGSNEVLRGRKILVVDDDARNIFALTSLLENHDMQVLSTTNGRSAVDIIENTPDLSIVLMDIMMPDMDGYETMREIRNNGKFRTLPILALTAKAMKGDREKCLDAGASDYIAKPVNTDQLLSLMRVWLFRLPDCVASSMKLSTSFATSNTSPQQPQTKNRQDGTSGVSASDDSPINILIVDDESKNLTVLETSLDNPGYRLVRAESADQALLALVVQEFALLILDIRMPGMSGFELAKIIKERKKTAGVPIIFLTAFYNEDQHVLVGYGTGAVDFLHKPVNAAILRSKVAVFAELYRKSRECGLVNDALLAEVTERRRAEEQLRELNETLEHRVTERTDALRDSEMRYRRLFEAAQDGVLILDFENGKIVDVNPFMTQLLGYSYDDFLGMELWNLGLFNNEPETESALRELKAKGYLRYERMPLKSKDGRRFEVEVVANVYNVNHQNVIQCNIRDITLRGRLEKQLQEQADKVIDLNRRKDEFLAMLSHELRSPLAPICNALQLLQLQQDSETELQQQARNIIERQTRQLQHLVDDLLEVSRITSGRLHLRKESVDVSEIIRGAMETACPIIDQRKHELTLSLPSEQIWLNADVSRMEQVLVNLLTNAAKYTDEGGHIWLSVEVSSEEASSAVHPPARPQEPTAQQPTAQEVVFRVRDSGVGIDPTLLPHIFDLFTQAERSLDRSQGGLGIGLALVHRLTEMHGGKVEARSVLGHGSEFIVRLPLTTSDTPESQSAVTDCGSSIARCLRVLVVDDNADTVESFSILLNVSGHNVRTAHDRPAAVQAALEYQPDVALLDIGLPGLDGYQVAKRIRQEPALKNVVLVAVTGYGQDSDRQTSLQAGFDHHLVKPARLEQLTQILAMVAERRP